jgi:hypothetical protein
MSDIYQRQRERERERECVRSEHVDVNISTIDRNVDIDSESGRDKCSSDRDTYSVKAFETLETV